jgi:tRNA-specific 2-thiouridylase
LTDRKRVLVAMSGGVDSSVAAARLLKDGYYVIGVTMRHFCLKKGEEPEDERSCCSIRSLEDARQTCNSLDIQHYTLDVEKNFRDKVADNFREEYLRGRTPNPCIRCNQYIRFPWMLKMAGKLETDYIATGHYARVEGPSGRNNSFSLLRGNDLEKDQSYFLWTMNQEELSRTLFPVGELSKPGVRELARKFGLKAADKPDSQEVCFIPDGDYREFLYQEGGGSQALQPGPIIAMDGRELGQHNGVASFTIGQRRGLGISNRTPLYVVEIHPESKTLVVGAKEDLRSIEFEVESAGWISGKQARLPLNIDVKIRYRHGPARALIEESDSDPSLLHLTFEMAQEAISPGQSAVFYSEDHVLGGGIISKVFR